MKTGWQIKKLNEVCSFENGDRGENYPSKSVQTTSGVPFINAGHLTEFGLDFENMNFIPRERFNLLGNGKIRRNDILFCLRGSLGKFACVGELSEGAIASSLVIIRPKEPVLNTFLSVYFQSDLCASMIDKYKNGAAQPNLSAGSLKNFVIPIPPLPEQQRIVAILDEAFAGIATAKANAEKNLQNARALFESHLNTIFTKRGKGWMEKSFDDVCRKITDGTHHSPKTQFPERAPGRFPYITSKNIRNNYMDLSNVAYIEQAFHEEVYARCQPSLGDVLLTKDGANTGNVTLNTLEEPFSLLSSVCLIKTNPNVLRPAFMCYYLQSSIGLSSIVGQMTGAAIKRIVLKDIKKATIPFPPLQEQDSLTNTLNSLLAETQRLTQLYEQKLAALEALKKSLLHQAFSGEL